ncbi:signal peptide peptidase SppA [Solimonas marina]|uniref:Signal peptide peptidase SppA n=1 Tax=Solimonas marina TaxID=2714601 RepID=A0A969WCI2_9GAMM|nr:signal peptide peptidase SppA [Solimonas marina]NKF24432.1 signal peptide peptidase SppA [Solimonas marina]
MSDKPRSILGRLFHLLWALVSGFLKLIVIVVVIAGLALTWLALRGGHGVSVENNEPLVVAPSGQLVDQVDEDPGTRFLQNVNGQPPSQSSVHDIVEAFELAKNDPRIPFAVLKLDGLTGAGLPQLEEIVAAMKDFQKSGKKIIAWSPSYDQSFYYAAAQADEVVMDPMGSVSIEGFSLYTNYFKDALDKLGVDVHVFRVGEYKSAVEPYTRNDMSPDARAANVAWLGDLWTEYGKGIGEGRKLAPTATNDYVNGFVQGMKNYQGDAAAYAKASGLVTSVETLDQFRQRIGAKVGMDDDIGSFRQIHYLDYLTAVGGEAEKQRKAAAKGTVAVVFVQGEIVDGPGDVGQAGGDTITDLLDQARRDDDVSAVVLRVNSPGGSVWASEQIRRAVDRLKTDGKPVVVSMSTLAASGGYWVSMDADQIFAHDTTITGSIGIFGMIPTIDRGLAKLGIHTDGVGTTALAGAFAMDRPLSPEVGEILQAQIDKGYRDFIGGVSKARDIPVEKVNEIARGRVWSGERAKQLGLIDQIGGLPQAEDAAAKLAGLGPKDYDVEPMSPKRDFATEVLSRFSSEISLAWVPSGVRAWLQASSAQSELTHMLSSFNDPQGMYARCFCTPEQDSRRH